MMITTKKHLKNVQKIAQNFMEHVQPGPDSIGAVALPRTRGGVAAQACNLVDLGAFKVFVFYLIESGVLIKSIAFHYVHHFTSHFYADC